MSIEKKDNTPQRKSIKKLSKLGSRKPADAPKRVIEQVPDWLLQLLGKHGEAPGPLIGLEDPSFAHDRTQADDLLLDEEAAQISALLEQMEEEGLPQNIDQRAATSVEWGRYDDDEHEISSGPIDDLLENLGRDEEDFFQETSATDDDWLTASISQGLTSETDLDDPYSSQTAADQPDWLADLIPTDESAPAPQTAFADSEDSVPDWLNDALETPATFDAEETDLAGEFPTDSAADYEVPDWLTDALDQSAETPAGSTAPPPSASKATGELEMPDWLAGDLNADSPAPPPPASKTEGELELPDWLAGALNIPTATSEPSLEEEDQDDDDDDDDIPDWLSQTTGQSITAEASKLPAVESPSDDVPDWLEADTPSSAEGLLTDDESDTADWLLNLRDEPAVESDIPDWLTSDDTLSTPPAPEPKAAVSDDIPDWLAADIGSESDGAATTTQAAAFDWLSDLRDSVSDDDALATDAFSSDAAAEDWLTAESEADSPASSTASRLDWLSEMDKPVSTEPPAEPTAERATLPGTGWLRDLEPPPGTESEIDHELSLEATSPDDTDWLHDLEPPPDAESETEALAERIIPPGTGWLRDLEPPPDSETEAETSAERIIPPGTGWLRDLEPPPGSQPEESEPAGDTALEIDDDDWLATISEASASEPAPPWADEVDDIEIDQPSDAIEPEALMGQASASDIDALSFLFSDETDEAAAELVTTSGHDSEEDIPDWLRAASAEADIDSEAEMAAALEHNLAEPLDDDLEADIPDWLADLRPASPPPVEVDEDDLPDWLKESPNDESDTLDEEPVEALIPDWLRESPLPGELDDDAAYSEQGNEPEPSPALADASSVPDWLGSDPDEVPDWLSDDVSDVPDWLTEADTPPTGAAETDLQAPDWLMDLPDTPAAETTKAADLTDQDLPAWLVDLPGEGRAESDENFESDMADWLSDLPTVDKISAETIKTSPEPLGLFDDEDDEDFLNSFDLEEPEFDTSEVEADDQEIPAWLTDSQSDDDTPAEDMTRLSSIAEDSLVETGSTAAPPADDWLAGLRQVAEQTSDEEADALEEELENTDWDLTASEITTPPATETETDPDTPDWLTRLRGTSTSPQPTTDSPDEIEDEDLPDWLSDQPVANTLAPPIEPVDEDEDDDLPDWLSELPAAAEIETPATDEPDLPDWLADQPVADTLAPPIEPADEDEDPDLPDWLSELPTAAEIETPATDDPDLPDWLSDQPKADALEPAVEPADEDEDADLPDWLSELPTAAEIESPATDEPDLPDWLADQPAADTLEPPIESAGEDTDALEPAVEDEDLPDWLSELPVAAEIETPATDEPDQPTWLSELPIAAEIETPATDDPDLPDWLTDQPATDTLEPVGEDEDADLPDWLTELPTAAEIETPATEEPDQPDWLAELPIAAKIETPVTEGEDLPDWLSEQPVADTLEPGEDPSDEGLPDWLSDQPKTDTPESAIEPADEDLPDWLADQPTPDTLESAIEPADEDLPDWLSELPAAAEIETLATDEPDLPDWLSDQPADDTLESAGEDEDLPDWLDALPAAAKIETPAADEPDLPDWLADQSTTDTLEPVGDDQDEDEDLPDWLDALPAAAKIETLAADEGEGEDEDIDLSAWFSDDPEPLASGITDTDGNLEMPGWFADLVEIADAEPMVTETDEAEEASWLDDLPEASEIDAMSISDDDDMPDWLSGLRSVAEIEPLESEESDIEPDLTDWLVDEPDTDDTPTPETAQPEADAPDPDSDLALFAQDKSQTEASQIEADPSDDDLDMPDWLADLPEPPEVEQVAAQQLHTDDLAMPAWLSSPLYADADAEAYSEAETPDQDQPAAADDDIPVWLAVLRETKGRDIDPNELRYDYDASELEHPTTSDTTLDDTALIAASLAVRAQPAADIAAPPEAETLDADENVDAPDWLWASPDDTIESELAQSVGDSIDADADLDTPAWLTDLADDNESPEPDTDTDLVMPPWLADQPDADEADADTDLDAPAWLTDLADDDESPKPDTGADLTMPAWLADQPDADETDADTDLAVPDWLADLSDTADSAATETDDDVPMPAWLADQPDDTAEAESPHLVAQSIDDAAPALAWLAHDAETEALEADEAEISQPDFDEVDPETLAAETTPVEAETAEASRPKADEVEAETLAAATMSIATDVTETDQLDAADTMAEDSGEDLVMPDWLFKGSLEELDTPDWLQDLPDIDQPADEAASAWSTDLADMTDEDDEALAAMAGSYTTASERLGLVIPDQEPAPPPPEPSEPPRETPPEDLAAMSGAPTESAGNLSGWLDALRTSEKTNLDDDDQQIAETTGMLAGLGSLMPAETLFTPSTKGPADDLDLAAKKFYEIATQPPQPVALPVPISRGTQFAGRTLRAVLLLLFIGLIALPLIPATHKVVNGSTVPWTEPTDNFSTVLDEQRHQLISEQLGIVDVQQPGSVALVSFDYSPATQGEMQPLAQAVLGRLAGQGMRIIAVSLEPEGPPMAQQTIETILADRDQADQYGQNVVNLGYLPGQVAAVRALATGRTFDTLTDFTTGEPFGSQPQADWNGIENIEQVDLVVTLADNPTTARWWIEQMEAAPQSDQRSILAATSAVANPFLRPYRQSEQLDGLISGIEGAAAIESVRNNFGPARRMLDSQSMAHLIVIILIAIGTMVGWMPQNAPAPKKEEKLKPAPSSSPEPPQAQHEPLPGDEDEPETQE